MRTRLLAALFLLNFSLVGCSSISLPSLPSLPWSSSPRLSDPTAEALFEEGTRYFSEKKYVRAIDAFQKIKTDYPFSPLLMQAELKVADAYYLNQQYPEAISAFKEFQSMHPTNENIPFVLYRLGQAHFDQFTTTDRDQKNTNIAKSYFETVVTTYANSPYAGEAKAKLAKCIEYLAEHEFNAAYFYFQQERYPGARDRFEEIVRKYRGAPTAAKSLFYLGESYRNEKNSVKAGLAYEALIQHYPQSRFAAEAKTQLAQLEKEKRDPLAMLLMRDRRPGAAPAPETGQETASSAKLKGIDNLVAKTEVVYEEPGEEKGFFRRVVDKINPFSSSDDGKKKEEKKPESAIELLAKKNAAEKEEPAGFLTTFWNGINPFGAKDSKDKKKSEGDRNNSVAHQVDDSLRQKGIDLSAQTVALKPPPADLPKVEEASPQTMDTGKLLGQIDSSLKKDGKNVEELPPPPEAAEVFKNAAAAQGIVAKGAAKTETQQSTVSSGLLSSIDQKLKSQGVEPAKFETPPPPGEPKESAPKKEQPKKIELEPKLAVEKGPLFLSPGEVQTQERAGLTPEPAKTEKKSESSDQPKEPAVREIPKALVRGPAQVQPATPAPKPAEQKKPAPGEEEEPKGMLEQLKGDVENIGKILNPFRW